MPTRRMFLASSAALAVLARIVPARSQGWPKRPVRIIFPYTPGSSSYGTASVVAQRLGHSFGQQFLVESRPGENGVLAAEEVARSRADGYTILWATTAPMVIAPAIGRVSYNPVRDFAPVSAITKNTLVLAVHPMIPATSVAEFLNHLHSRLDKLIYAEAGIGSMSHVAMALFLRLAGMQMNHVSHKGNAPALMDVVAGHASALLSLLGNAMPHATNGGLRLLAVAGETRAAAAPSIPTIAESGFPGFKAVPWNGLIAPAGTPNEIVNILAAHTKYVVRSPKLIENLTSYGITLLGNEPEEFAAMISADLTFWREGIHAAGLARTP
jgi:tripartite-type tricarboxylate transporter receptor subunit TctC